ncbi:MAG: hypothetical protein HOH66_08165, partial [Rhodospirillaceae bacterium]|nr:hypothetical protein [Rhodospirillaceae bacterium]
MQDVARDRLPGRRVSCGPAEQGGRGASIGSDGALIDAGSLVAFRAPPLVAGEAHVWFARGGDPARFEALLDPEELARADRFVFPEHRARFFVA